VNCAEKRDERAAEAEDWSRSGGNRKSSCQCGFVLGLTDGLKRDCLARALRLLFPSLPPEPTEPRGRKFRRQTGFDRAHSDASGAKEQCTEGEEKVDRR